MLTIPKVALPKDITVEEVIRLVHLGKSLEILQKEKPTSQVAAVIGQIGEQIIRQIYEKTYIVDNVSKQGRAGDILLRRVASAERPIQHTILVEVKNYSITVNSAEVEKFYRDLLANSSISGGIFISLNTKIAGISDAFHLSYRGEIPVLFVCLEGLSEDHVQRTVLLAADLLWAFIDSRHSVDEEIFQKLSSKITRLSDCLNSLSMGRTYINETRTVMDKQLNKIYESVLSTELQMRQIIGSISKTLSGGSVVGGGSSAQITIPDPNFDALQEVISTHFPTSLLVTGEGQTELITSILEEYFQDVHWPDYVASLDVVVEKKGVSIIYNGVDGTNPQTLITLGLLKTRTDLSFVPSYIPTTTVDVPSSASYSDGVITFSLDKKSVENGCFEVIKTFIDHMEQQEMLELKEYVEQELE